MDRMLLGIKLSYMKKVGHVLSCDPRTTSGRDTDDVDNSDDYYAYLV